ncbi:MAG: hypothetical protein N2202_07345, partial [Proteobacteria bacterium]|nr:hypothetical protein [Pseudomonadota bacterium]
MLKKIYLLMFMFLMVVLTDKTFAQSPSFTLNAILGSEKGFISPIGIATDGTNVYVADYGANKIFKIDPAKNVNTFVNINRPIGVAFANNRVIVATESNGGKIFDASNANLLASFGSGFSGSESFKNIIKPSDVAVGPDNYIYVTDMEDKYIKTYMLSTGAFVSLVGNGPFPIQNATSSFGNGQFYMPSGLTFDNSTGKLLVSDYGNFTPYFQLTLKWNPFKRQYDRLTTYSGRPKGKVQIFVNSGSGYNCNPGTIGARQFVVHGLNPLSGEALTVSGIFTDNNYIFLLDSLNQKLFLFANAAIDSKVQTTSSGAFTYPV